MLALGGEKNPAKATMNTIHHCVALLKVEYDSDLVSNSSFPSHFKESVLG